MPVPRHTYQYTLETKLRFFLGGWYTFSNKVNGILPICLLTEEILRLISKPNQYTSEVGKAQLPQPPQLAKDAMRFNFLF